MEWIQAEGLHAGRRLFAWAVYLMATSLKRASGRKPSRGLGTLTAFIKRSSLQERQRLGQ